jgi:hypothetical protein
MGVSISTNDCPGHPLALAKLAAVTLRNGKPEERESNIPRARLWANLALKYAHDDAAVRAVAEPVLRDTASPDSTTTP